MRSLNRGESGALQPRADRAITSGSADLLGRGAFVRRAAQVVNELPELEDSSVVALVGPWGSGKTSSINITCEQLGEAWQVCWVNTWTPPDVSALLADVFAAIRSALPEGARMKGVGDRLAEYAQLAIPLLGLVPTVGGTAQQVAANFVQFRASRPLQSRVDDLTRELAGLGLRVLVVLDDVDRLEPDELLALFKAVRLLARFPGVYYLIAYDEQTVVDLLKSTAVASGSNARALAYLEKIIQVRLDLPPAQRFHTEQLIGAGLADLLGRLGVSLSAEQSARFRVLYDRLLQFTLAQPRAVGTFLRQASVYLPMADLGEIDVVDFVALTHLRSLVPATYRLIARSKSMITTSPGDGNESARERVQEELAGECADHRDQVTATLGELFPSLAEDPSLLQPGDWQDRAAARRVCAEEYFDRYFLFGLPADDIADATVLAAITAIGRAEVTPAREAVESAIAGADAGRADRLIRKLTRLSSSPAQRNQGELLAVLSYALTLPECQHGDRPLLLGSPDHHSITWARAVTGRLISNGQAMPPGFAAALDDLALARLCHALREMTCPGAEERRTLASISEATAQIASERIRDNLRQRDQARLDVPIILLVRFVNATSSRLMLAGMISCDLDDQRFTLEDLVSRFVSTGVFADGRSEVTGFDREALAALLGLPALIALTEADMSSESTTLDQAEGDTGWPGRRRAGVARFRRALQQMRSEPPRPPSCMLTGNRMSPLQQTSPSHWGNRITRGPSSADSGDTLICLRAVVLIPGSASGLPSGLGSTAVSEETRARTVAKILNESPLTGYCHDAARRDGAAAAPEWAEDGNSNRVFADFALRQHDPGASGGAPAARCMITAGASSPGSEALSVALDLFPSPPLRPLQHDSTPGAGASGETLALDELADLTEIVTRSAIYVARSAASSLLDISPDDGHLAVWLESSRPLDQVTDMTAFPTVGSQGTPPEVSIFASLPLAPGHSDESAQFASSLRGIAVELIHELLRAGQRRDYIEYLHQRSRQAASHARPASPESPAQRGSVE